MARWSSNNQLFAIWSLSMYIIMRVYKDYTFVTGLKWPEEVYFEMYDGTKVRQNIRSRVF